MLSTTSLTPGDFSCDESNSSANIKVFKYYLNLMLTIKASWFNKLSNNFNKKVMK